MKKEGRETKGYERGSGKKLIIKREGKEEKRRVGRNREEKNGNEGKGRQER